VRTPSSSFFDSAVIFQLSDGDFDHQFTCLDSTTTVVIILTMPSQSSAQETKLLWTAVGAAIAGAASTVLALKWYELNKAAAPSTKSEDRFGHAPSRPSLIFEDPTRDNADSHTIVYPFNHEEKMRRRIAARAEIEEENFQPRNSVTVRVPATSANMGPGCKYL
jgi:hypothetical protein